MEALYSSLDISNASNEIGATGPYQVVGRGHVPRCLLDVYPTGTERPSSSVDFISWSWLGRR